MRHFDYLTQFEKELKHLSKKYRSLPKDLQRLETLLAQHPLGVGMSFTVLHTLGEIYVVKGRLACESLKAKSLRVIYAYSKFEEKIEFIEVYFKGDKENEDKERIKEYLKKLLIF